MNIFSHHFIRGLKLLTTRTESYRSSRCPMKALLDLLLKTHLNLVSKLCRVLAATKDNARKAVHEGREYSNYDFSV